jgi:oligopeptidase A
VRSLAGTNVAWDFVELPSQIMENWCWERAALDLFARHWPDRRADPRGPVRQAAAPRNFRAANATMRQLGFAAVDLALHTGATRADGDVSSAAREILSRTFSPPCPTTTR